MTTVASKSVKAHIQPNESKEFYSLSFDGRSTSVLGKSQGDHVTAYRLVEMGLCRALDGIARAEVDELFKLQNRTSLRTKRSKLYDFISAIAVINPSQAESLYRGIDKILIQYNTARTAKTVLRERTRTLQNDTVLLGDNLRAALGNVEQLYNKNGEHIRDTLTEVARLVLTFYNHIPHTAYFPIKGFEAASSEGSMVRMALSAFDANITACRSLPDDSIASRTKRGIHLTAIIKSISDLMHYPEITNVNKLTEHETYCITNKTKLSKPRDNSRENLVTALAKHLHITFAVYPELNTMFSQDDIVIPFVARMISGKEQNKVLWPKFNNAQDIDSIKQDVSAKLTLLKGQLQQKDYTVRDAYKDLESSDDEEETTVPIKKESPQIALMQELIALRAYKEAMEVGIKAGKVRLTPGFNDILKKQFPALYPATKSSELK